MDHQHLTASEKKAQQSPLWIKDKIASTASVRKESGQEHLRGWISPIWSPFTPTSSTRKTNSTIRDNDTHNADHSPFGPLASGKQIRAITVGAKRLKKLFCFVGFFLPWGCRDLHHTSSSTGRLEQTQRTQTRTALKPLQPHLELFSHASTHTLLVTSAATLSFTSHYAASTVLFMYLFTNCPVLCPLPVKAQHFIHS